MKRTNLFTISKEIKKKTKFSLTIDRFIHFKIHVAVKREMLCVYT